MGFLSVNELGNSCTAHMFCTYRFARRRMMSNSTLPNSENYSPTLRSIMPCKKKRLLDKFSISSEPQLDIPFVTPCIHHVITLGVCVCVYGGIGGWPSKKFLSDHFNFSWQQPPTFFVGPRTMDASPAVHQSCNKAGSLAPREPDTSWVLADNFGGL